MAVDLLAETSPKRRGWFGFAATRLVRLAAIMVAVSVAAFGLMSASPIDPVQAYVGAEAARIGPERRAAIAEAWGLNDPPVERFMRWAEQVVQGNLGESQVFRQPVTEVIGERFVTSLALMAAAWALSALLGYTMGVIAGMNRGRWVDRVLSWWAYTLASAPTFWIGLLLLYVFAVWLKVAPVCCAVPIGVTGDEVTILDRVRHLVLPAVSLSIVGTAPIMLHTRQTVIETLQRDHVAFARSQGEHGWGLIRHHVLRNVSPPALTLAFASFGELFGGSILAEQVFSYPGLGQATTTAALRQDVPLLLGITLFVALFVFVGNLLGDITHRAADPRIRLGDLT